MSGVLTLAVTRMKPRETLVRGEGMVGNEGKKCDRSGQPGGEGGVVGADANCHV